MLPSTTCQAMSQFVPMVLERIVLSYYAGVCHCDPRYPDRLARIFPFQPYRYSAKAGPVENLVTQPYDKISPEMQARYLSLSPYNLVRLILGERFPTDTGADNVYTRAAGLLRDWIAAGILERDAEPRLYAYFQKFTVPDTGETRERKGFIGMGAVEDYSAGVVHRHEQTLSGPKKDRLELLRHTRAHFGQIFMLYPDPELAIDGMLDHATSDAPPVMTVEDEYDAVHRVWKITDPAAIARIQELMADKKLLIADGHHRYETALAFRKENPGLKDAEKVMMTFVNTHSPGLEILATHRVLSGISADLISNIRARPLASVDELKQVFRSPAPDRIRIGLALASGEIRLYERARKPGELDVKVLHEELLGRALGISEEAVREQKHIEYVRGLDAACARVRQGAQIAFLLEPATIQQVADVAFSGGVMPQKSTDFYPKLLSGLTIYKLEQ
jgi:uncharacterized protein (DUF1015 family)